MRDNRHGQEGTCRFLLYGWPAWPIPHGEGTKKMKQYICRRLLQAIIVIFGISVVVFFILHLSGDPTLLLLPPSTPVEEVEAFRESMGFNDPIIVQYIRFIKDAIRGDFGDSLIYSRPALDMVLERFPATIELAVCGALLAVLIGVPLGVLAAVKRDGPIDFIARTIAVIGQAVPSFWMGLLMILLFSITLGLLPTSGRGDTPLQLVMPVLTVGLFSMAAITRQSRSAMLEVLSSDYVRTARAKGLSRIGVLYHALRNALLPVVTMVGLEVGHLLGGSVITETVFGWPGIGKLAVDSIYSRDYPVVQAVVMISATVFVVINLLVDIGYCFIDPRIKLNSMKK